MSQLTRPFRRMLATLDAGFTRLYGVAWNPLHQPGTVAVAMLLVMLATGLYLVFLYRVGGPAESVARVAEDPWLGSWIRSLHRYASDLFVIAAVIHAIRMLLQRRSWGPRSLAWLSGVFLLGIGLLCAWTGFVMAWDSFGQRLALEGARLLDALPILSEPVGRIFAGEGPVPSAFFFVNLFLHIAIPLAMGAGLWLHVSRLARPVLLPPRRVLWGVIAALLFAAIVRPAPLGPAADPLVLPATTPLNVVTAWWLPLSERLPPLAPWLGALAMAGVAVLVPRFTRRPRAGAWAPSSVDPRLCTGCNQCPQDCPWDAITMVARTDDRPTLVAQVDPSRCVSCGICAGSCAPMGVGPPGRAGRDQLADLRQGLLPRLAQSTPGAAALVVICCANAPAAQRAALQARGGLVHLVPCVGNLHSSVVELLIRAGAPGVVVGGCPPRDCVGREGPKWLQERLFNDREAELQPRVDRRRVRVITLAPGARADAEAALDAFVLELAMLAPAQAESAGDLTLDLLCVPVPVAKETT